MMIKENGLLTVVVLLMMPVLLMANPVGKDEARQKAMSFISERRPAMARGTQLEQDLKVELSNESYHVFNLGSNDGFVIVSGDDCADDILGYADSGTFDAENMPDNLKAWLQGYAEQIALLKAGSAKVSKSRAATRGSESWSKISPLLKSKWNQNDPYNQQVPLKDGKRCVTGCVATSMAQVMYYWYKTEGFEAELKNDIPASYEFDTYITLLKLTAPATFDWSNMTDTYGSSSTDKEKDAVAKLMKYCGYSVMMRYGLSGEGGSSAHGSEIAPALTDYFDYKSARCLERPHYSYEDWQEVVYADLAASRPVIMNGLSAGGGHSFVCDGYDEDDYFHFNWGWSGKSDGYYKLALCNPKDQGIGGSTTTDGYYMRQNIICCHPTKTISSPIEPMESASYDDISVTSIDIPTLNSGEIVDITVTIKNNNTTTAFNNDIFLYMKGKKWYRLSGAACYVAANSSQSIVIPSDFSNYQVSDNWPLYVAYFDSNNNFQTIYNVNVNIGERLPDLTGSVKIYQDHAEALSPLTFIVSGDAASLPSYDRKVRWQVSKNGDDRWEDIAGATASSYTPQLADIDKYLRVVFSVKGYHSLLVSPAVKCEKTALTGTVTYNNAQPSPSNPIAYLLSGKVKEVDASLIKAQWQCSGNGIDGWTDIAGKTGVTYWLSAADVGKYFRVMITATGFDGALYGPLRRCVKWSCTKEVVAPELEISTAYNQVRVTNPNHNQEYTILNYYKNVNDLTTYDWSIGKSPGPDDIFLFMGGTENSINYVYTRVKETETTRASTDVRMEMIYFGKNIYTQGIRLKPRKATKSGSNIITEELEQASDGYYVKQGDVIQIEVTSIPGDATDFDGILGSKWSNNSNDGDFFTNFECYIPVNPTSSYKKVYFKPKEQANKINISAEKTLGYNQIAYDTFTLNVGDESGNCLIDNLGMALDVNKHDVLKDIELMNIHPVKASLDDVTVKLSSGSGTAPVVTINKEARTIDVDATNATKGNFNFDIYQGSRKIDGGLLVSVTTPPVEKMKVQPSELWLDCGESQQLTAFLFPAEAEEEITWESSNMSLATVSADGVVTMSNSADIGATVTITAKAGGKSATCNITVPGEIYNLYLAGIQVTSRNKDNLAELVAETSEASMEQFSTGKMEISFDGTTLRLKDAVIDTGDKAAQGMTLGINGMTLIVEGDCTVKSKNYNGLKVANNATITGDGSLRLEGKHSGIMFDSPSEVYITTLTLDHVKVEALGSTLSIDGGLNPDYSNMLQVNHSDLTATGQIFFANGDILLDESYYVEPKKPYFRYNGDFMDGEQVATGLKIRPFDKGDVNQDGKVDATDLVLTISYTKGQNPAKFLYVAADVNGDSHVDQADVKLIADIILDQYIPLTPIDN